MSTKKFVCDKIEFAPVYYISSIADQVVTFESAKSFEKIIIRSGMFKEELKQSEAGDLVKQTLNFSCISDISVIDLLKTPGVFRLTFSDSETKVFGSLDNPVRFSSLIVAGRTKKIAHERKAITLLVV